MVQHNSFDHAKVPCFMEGYEFIQVDMDITSIWDDVVCHKMWKEDC